MTHHSRCELFLVVLVPLSCMSNVSHSVTAAAARCSNTLHVSEPLFHVFLGGMYQHLLDETSRGSSATIFKIRFTSAVCCTSVAMVLATMRCASASLRSVLSMIRGAKSQEE